MFIPSADRGLRMGSALLGEEVGYSCASASLMRVNDARRKKTEEALKSKLYRSVINSRVIDDIKTTGNDDSP